MSCIAFIDTEVSTRTKKVEEYAAVLENDSIYRGNNIHNFVKHIESSEFICGHNILGHDLKYFEKDLKKTYFFIDTLLLSPLIYPKSKHHNLLKDDKLVIEELNNPVNDCKKTRDLFYKELSSFRDFDMSFQYILYDLLSGTIEFKGFFNYLKLKNKTLFKFTYKSGREIKKYFNGKICSNCNIEYLIKNYPIELAYALALINSSEGEAPAPWVQINYPNINLVLKILRETKCNNNCIYCSAKLNARNRLKEIFHYDSFRKFDGANLQEDAVNSAINGESLLAIFPTGGGKSITFQLPALIAGESSKGLTVVISPLQSLMKDQVDSLHKKNIIDAVTINGLLNPIERQEAIERVFNGRASLLYISPESLRSKTIERLLISRNVVRFVIDEAHCFSSWGHDFRVDYLYIGDFIDKIQKLKNLNNPIPVSCFTATAKPKVISDICDYFKKKLNISLKQFTTNAVRENLKYKVEYKKDENEKYIALRELIKEKNCPTIIYVSTTKKTFELAQRLTDDKLEALPYNGKMERNEKIENQEKFINDNVKIIVATSAFGMGVDKPNVKLVVHYEISDSLENYIQEAGRAGRDPSIQAECVVFYNEDDLNTHFMLFSNAKLTMHEIRKVWIGIKNLTARREEISCSALEIARAAGWDDTQNDIETRIRTAISALEIAGYIERGINSPRVFATSIHVKNIDEARNKMVLSKNFTDKEMDDSARILQRLLSKKNISRAGNDDAEDRVDYIADIIGLDKKYVIDLIIKMKAINILEDLNDMSCYIKKDEINKIEHQLSTFFNVERFMLEYFKDPFAERDLKTLNDSAIKSGIKKSSTKIIKNILLYWTIKGYIKKTNKTNETNYDVKFEQDIKLLEAKAEIRLTIAQFIFNHLVDKFYDNGTGYVSFSVGELHQAFNNRNDLFSSTFKASVKEIQDALLYLSKINILNIEGGFLVIYNAMHIRRIIKDNKIQYKNEDYKALNDFYNLKIQQIHIVGNYADMMVKDYNQALEYVNDYFHLEYDGFIKKYFKGDKKGQIQKNITQAKYNRLFGDLSLAQKKIIDDDKSQYISVIAGPGSGKTRVLVHKLASLLLLENVRQEQLLMLTFSRAAATEFKERLLNLEKAAYFVDIKTFHSYCFDLLGKHGNEEEFDDVITTAIQMIEDDEVEPGKITKSVLVIDEAQDMDEKEYRLIRLLIEKNPDMKVIAVGDDDQNIYEFRGSNSHYMSKIFEEKENVKKYELIENYRSGKNIVKASNIFSNLIKYRMKQNPILSLRKDNDEVKLIKYSSNHLEQPIVDLVKNDINKNKKIAVLTSTNDEALKVVGLLNKNKIPAKLIQSNEGFSLIHLAEIRYFYKKINNKAESPIVDDFTWNNAKLQLNKKYKESCIIEIVDRIIDKFERLNRNKYKSDFLDFVRESNFEDFFDYENSNIIVSTIHKAKGHEFDIVHLLLKDITLYSSAIKRKIYVGMTRAKIGLIIHYNNDSFDFMKKHFAIENNNLLYEEPTEILLHLTHKDIRLGTFKNEMKKKEILSHVSGESLNYKNHNFFIDGYDKELFRLSNKYVEYLEELTNKGYQIIESRIKYILSWFDKEDKEKSEYAIILPEIILKKE